MRPPPLCEKRGPPLRLPVPGELPLPWNELYGMPDAVPDADGRPPARPAVGALAVELAYSGPKRADVDELRRPCWPGCCCCWYEPGEADWSCAYGRPVPDHDALRPPTVPPRVRIALAVRSSGPPLPSRSSCRPAAPYRDRSGVMGGVLGSRYASAARFARSLWLVDGRGDHARLEDAGEGGGGGYEAEVDGEEDPASIRDAIERVCSRQS